jgi:hypothetical protein
MGWLVVALALTLVAAGCGDDDDEDDDAATTTTAAVTTTAAPAQTMTVTPATGLTDGQTVHVEAKGFSPNAQRGIIQCADKGAETGQGDCNIGGIQVVTTDANGTISADFKVVKGPFGENQIVCGPTQKCLLSANDLTAEPKEVTTADIEFA